MPGRLFKPACVITLAGQTFSSGVTAQGGALVGALNQRGLGLRMVGRVRRTMTPQPDTAEIAIENIAPERRKAIETLFGELGSAKLAIQVGYDGLVLHLFAGDVRAPLRANVLEGASIVTRVTADDGGDTLTDATFAELAALTGTTASGTTTSGLTADDMITLALSCFATKNAAKRPVPDPPIVRHPSVDAAVASSVAAYSLFNVVSISKASDLLNEAARILGVRWWIRDHQLFMAKRGAPTDPLAALLPRTHWLSEPSEDGNGILRVSTFLDPTITPGRQVVLIGRTDPFTKEVYRADECEYAFDTEGGPWSLGLALRRVTVGA